MGGRGSGPDRFGPGMQHGWGMGPGAGWLGVLALLALLALAATVVVLLVKLNRQKAALAGVAAGVPVAGAASPGGVPGAPASRDALSVLDERLARGDIDVADYEARRRALTGAVEPGASDTRIDPLA